MGILKVGQLAAYPTEGIEKKLGKFGLELFALAHGEDDRSVSPESEAKSISQEETNQNRSTAAQTDTATTSRELLPAMVTVSAGWYFSAEQTADKHTTDAAKNDWPCAAICWKIWSRPRWSRHRVDITSMIRTAPGVKCISSSPSSISTFSNSISENLARLSNRLEPRRRTGRSSSSFLAMLSPPSRQIE
jgi:nucleotidyltransferase/DNA polymerase involved in DNA repair